MTIISFVSIHFETPPQYFILNFTFRKRKRIIDSNLFEPHPLFPTREKWFLDPFKGDEEGNERGAHTINELGDARPIFGSHKFTVK